MLLLTALSAINTVILIIAGFSGTEEIVMSPDGSLFLVETGVDAFRLIQAALCLAVTIGLWFRKNAAWALTIIGCVLSLVDVVLSKFHVVSVAVLVPVLVVLFLPATRSWYKPTAGRNHLSVSKPLFVTLGVIVGIPVLLVIVAMLAGG